MNVLVTSERGLELIRGEEGLVCHLYNDKAGHCTIGYGHLVHLGPCCGAASEQPFLNGLYKEHAEALFRLDVAQKAESIIHKLVTAPLTQNQFDALSSFVYNLGGANFASSHLLLKLNQGDYAGAAAEFPRWNKAGGVVLSDLVHRRAHEQALFMEA